MTLAQIKKFSTKKVIFRDLVNYMKHTLLTICQIFFALPSWGQTTFSGGNISGGSVNAIIYSPI